jgi:uncharacterized HAD superfamily protein
MARWLVDFDDTLADLYGTLQTSCNERFGTDYSPSMVTGWDWWREATPKEHGDFVWGDECFNSCEWTLSIPPAPFAVEVTQRLAEMGEQLFVVSDRPQHMWIWLAEWLGKHNIPYAEVYTTNKKNYPRKIDVAEALSLTIAVEDAPHHGTEMPASGLFDMVYLIDKPYNRDVPLHDRLDRVQNWEELLDVYLWGNVD